MSAPTRAAPAGYAAPVSCSRCTYPRRRLPPWLPQHPTGTQDARRKCHEGTRLNRLRFAANSAMTGPMTSHLHALFVHLFTATGAVFAMLAMLEAAQADWSMMFLWLVVAFF